MSERLATIMTLALIAGGPMSLLNLGLSDSELGDIDIVEEFKKVQAKQSRLSARLRTEVCVRFYREYPTLCRVCGEPHRLQVEDAGTDRECLRVCEHCYRECAEALAELN